MPPEHENLLDYLDSVSDEKERMNIIYCIIANTIEFIVDPAPEDMLDMLSLFETYLPDFFDPIAHAKNEEKVLLAKEGERKVEEEEEE
jgi:hypothetical protein